MGNLCPSRNRVSPFSKVLDDIPLEPLRKRIVVERYTKLVTELENQTFRISICFHTSRSIITVGSLIVPALLSIQYTSSNGSNLTIYWTTWVVSLLVTICNGLSTLLKIDKQYFHLHTVREQLISDGWQYLELTGKYSGFHTPGHPATHENQFIFFCHSVEKIRMKQIQEDYYKVNESQQQGTANQNQNALTSTRIVPTLLPPTPLQGELALIPTEIKRAMEEISNTVVAVDDQASNT